MSSNQIHDEDFSFVIVPVWFYYDNAHLKSKKSKKKKPWHPAKKHYDKMSHSLSNLRRVVRSPSALRYYCKGSRSGEKLISKLKRT